MPIAGRMAVAGAAILAVVTGLLPGLSAVLPLADVAPAGAATRNGRHLQVIQEVTSTSAGGTITLTAKLKSTPGDGLAGSKDAPADASSGTFFIDFEVMSGPADVDGDTPETPDSDSACVIPPGSTSCTINITSAVGGTSFVRGWMDLDNNNATVEADRAEGRVASTADPTSGGADCLDQGGLPNPANSDTADEGTCTGTAQPGDQPEPDATDVVQTAWTGGTSGSATLDCHTARGGPDETDRRRIRDAGKVICTHLSASGAPVNGTRIDAENLTTSVNDPDERTYADTSNTTPDYNTGTDGGTIMPADQVFCTTGADGKCTATISGAKGQTGTANICFWVDGNNNNVFNSTTEGDGGGCNEAATPETPNLTDVVGITWATPQPSGVDLKPENQTVTPQGSSPTPAPAKVTAFVYDQFGDAYLPESGTGAGGAQVNFEFFDGSISDSKAAGETTGNTPESPDKSCTTATSGNDPAPGSCFVTFSQGEANRLDVLCGWVGAAPTMSGSVGSTSTPLCNSEGLTDTSGEDTAPSPFNDNVDVVQVNYQNPPPVPPPDPDNGRPKSGYWLVGSDGGIFAFGDANFFGSTGAVRLNRPIVGMAATPTRNGYWLVASDGGIFAFGDARFFGSTGAIKLNKDIVGMAETHTGLGYWLVASDGGIFAFGDAPFLGSTGSLRLNQPIVGMARTPTSRGYWLVASDGGIFAYGDSGFFGSTGAIKLNSPIVGMSATVPGKGYWLVAADGGIFAYGDAAFYGSAGSLQLTSPIISIVVTTSGKGYWLMARDGGIFSYGDAQFKGSTGNIRLTSPIVGADGF